MKKRVIFFIIIIILIMIFVVLVIQPSLIKNYGDFKGFLATSRRVSLTVSPSPAIPIISIISPENTTYSTNTILLNYSITNEADSIWYNLDNGGNITINSPIFFDAAEGSHILYLYANNSQGTSVKSVIFSIKIEIAQPPSGGGGGGGGGSGGNKTGQQEENITESKEPSSNVTEQETPKNITKNPEETPRTPGGIIIKFLISLLFLVLLMLLVIILIAAIKRKLKKTRQKKK